jgi:hypothetical protein
VFNRRTPNGWIMIRRNTYLKRQATAWNGAKYKEGWMELDVLHLSAVIYGKPA